MTKLSFLDLVPVTDTGTISQSLANAADLAHHAEALGYAQKRVNEATGDAHYFNSLLAEYMKAPEVTRKRMYLETMSEILPKLGPKLILDDQTKGLLPLLPLQPGASLPIPTRQPQIR